MNGSISSAPFQTARKIFSVVFVVVSLVVFGWSILQTIFATRSYVCTARLRIEPNPRNATALPSASASFDPRLVRRELEIIQSEPVLDKVVERLDLQESWGRKYSGLKLAKHDARQLLSRSIAVHTVRDTSLIEIRIYGDNPSETVHISNSLLDAYQAQAAAEPERLRVQVVGRAELPVRPVSPNIPLQLTFGLFKAAAFGAGAGLMAGGFVLWSRRRGGPASPASSLPPVLLPKKY